VASRRLGTRIRGPKADVERLCDIGRKASVLEMAQAVMAADAASHLETLRISTIIVLCCAVFWFCSVCFELFCSVLFYSVLFCFELLWIGVGGMVWFACEWILSK